MKKKRHNEAWFDKQERRLQEPIKNTKRYYYKRNWLMIATVIIPVIGWILAVIGLTELLKMRKYLSQFTNFTLDFMGNGRTVTNDGPPGSGKTFTGANTAYFLAVQRWEELKSEYFTQRTMIEQWVKEGKTDKIEDFKALQESFEFYADREADFIPCLVSSIPLREYGTGRMSYVLPPELFLQEVRCPEYTVIFNDESGMLFGAETSKTNNVNLKDFWRFIRQFCDGMSVNTNQDGSQNAIYMRRSTDYVNHLYGQEWLMPPVRLNKQVSKLEMRYFKKLYRGKLSGEKALFLGQELYYLKKYAKTIGFRCVRHRLCTPQGMPVGDVEKFILPAIGGVEYDDRTFRNLYKCKDMEIDLQGWDKLKIDEYDRAEYDDRISADD